MALEINAIPFVAAGDLQKLGIDEMRKLLRMMYPVGCRGAFATYASKQVCERILGGNALPDDYVVTKNAANQLVVVIKSIGAAIIEGAQAVASDGTIVAGLDRAPLSAFSAELEEAGQKAAKMLGMVSPGEEAKLHQLIAIAKDATAEVVRLKAENAEQASVTRAAPVSVVSPDGKTVKIAGVDVPHFADPLALKHGAKEDPHYNFGYWRAKTKSAAGTVSFDAADLMNMLLAGHNIHLWGDPSVGKTSVIEQAMQRAGWPCVRVVGDPDFQAGDMLGEKTVSNGNIEYQYGPLPMAMKMGAVFIADEIDYFPADVRTALNSVLEPGGKLILTNNGGEIIEKHPNFRFVCTSNTQLFGDPSGLYPDAKVQNAALLSRIPVSLHVQYMAPKHEQILLQQKTGVSKELAKLMVKIANDTRASVEAGKMLYALTTRHLLAWACLAQSLGDPTKAFACCVIEKLPPSDAAVALEIAQRHMGEKLKVAADAVEATDAND